VTPGTRPAPGPSPSGYISHCVTGTRSRREALTRRSVRGSLSAGWRLLQYRSGSMRGVCCMEAPMPSFSRALHIALTVRDMRVSADWYQRVLGFEFVKEFKVAPDDAGIPRILLLHQHSGFLLGLCDHPGRSGETFDPRRTGLDHIAFEVADRAELTSWMTHLDGVGVAHSPVRTGPLVLRVFERPRWRSDRAVADDHATPRGCQPIKGYTSVRRRPAWRSPGTRGRLPVSCALRGTRGGGTARADDARR
jgi:glyoxylase I family protein